MQSLRPAGRVAELGSLGVMKSIFVLALIVASSAVAADDPVATLRTELAGLNLAAPKVDAERDIAQDQAVCFSINGYAKYFPSVPDEDRESCEAREKNFRGTWDVVLNKEHEELISQASTYSERYNAYVLHHRK